MVFPSLAHPLNQPNNWNQPPQGHQQAAAITADDGRKPPPQDVSGGPGPTRPGSMAERARIARIPQPEVALSCPRCDSSNTKFCYYNNYSLTQPRHFCKTCRRYWTRGGALRNVPVGGGCRSNKRCGKSSSFSSTTSPTLQPSKSPSSTTATSAPTANLGPVWEGVADRLGSETWSGIQLPSARFSKSTIMPNRSLVLLSAAPSLAGAPWNQQQEHGYAGPGLEQWRFPYLGGMEATAAAGTYNYREGEWSVGGGINGNGGGWVNNSVADHVLGFGGSSSTGNGNL